MISKQQQNMVILDEEINFVQSTKMQDMPTNLSLDKNNQNCDNEKAKEQDQISKSPKVTSINSELQISEELREKYDNTGRKITVTTTANEDQVKEFASETRIQLSFSVDRLLSNKTMPGESLRQQDHKTLDSGDNQCCGEMNNGYSCCSLPNCLVNSSASNPSMTTNHLAPGNTFPNTMDEDMHTMSAPQNVMDFKSIVRPTPMRAMGNNAEQVTQMAAHYASITPSALIRLHHAQMHQKPLPPHPIPAQTNFSLNALMSPLCSMKTMGAPQHQLSIQNFPVPSPIPNNRYSPKASINFDIPGMRPNMNCISNLRHHHLTNTASNESHINFQNIGTNTSSQGSNSAATSSASNTPSHISNNNGKRKRSWSRAVFSNLQRKGLEIQFQQQKYITKPDRRKLAARLNLTDAQVKVWFQNRRMKWRHTRENLKSGQEKQPSTANNNQPGSSLKANSDSGIDNLGGTGYSSDGSSSLEMSDADDDEDEIDVVE
ncbi:homeodomain protein 2.0 [Haematobia irritans]|uniref:homeodomain protein 2.0 n=1 Tax=Haematobia irritans TaxID=7368 RepID=UPI003F50C506